VFRKRKIFHGRSSFNDLLDVVKKHKDDNFLLPCSNIHGDEITSIMDNIKLKYTKSVFYNTVCSNLSDLENVFYDILVFFSPYDIKSLFENFPNFKQNNTRIAAFGKTTVEACEEAKLIVNIPAPTSKAPSMTMALEQYIASVNK
jgi:uroporphyrinogen-III synthase